MLTELRITNFAVIEQLSLNIDSGFTVLTGETGTGKSLLIDAVALLVGGRASNDQIRFGADEAHLEASFEIPPAHPILQVLRAQEILGPQDSELIIRRIIARSGRNRVYLNGVLSPVHLLEEFAGTLIDIHGQHDQQSLLSNPAQLEVLDAFGRLQELRLTYRTTHQDWVRSRQERAELAVAMQQRAQREDLLKFQRQELDEAVCRIGEEEILQAERQRLGSSHRLAELVSEAQERIQGDGHGILADLALTERVLGELTHIDPEMEGTSRLASEAKVLLKEVADSLRSYTERLDADPMRLMAIEDRLALIQNMKKKYGGTIEAVLATHERVKDELEQLWRSDSEIERYDRLIHEQQVKVSDLARQLSDKRKEAAKRLTKLVGKELDALRMGSVRFLVQVMLNEAYGSDGVDRVEFLLSANVGEPLKPMSRVASGGELSRVMLALKSVLADVDHVPVLIFDEIDTGVGGAVAATIGKRLRALGQYHQVLCITHLPQVASQARHHFCVEKSEVKGRTVASVRVLAGMSREGEIARMLGGERVTQKTRATAAELIAGAHE
ncbi:MAG: DNA repair protein RecN [Nitrospira sp.]|jgi:DNA repair protein RecN (Recombination protein N)|nr:DNA repair protein RecN [Nitrospira sp. BO4]